MPKLSSPQAFEFCDGGTCGDAKPSGDNKHVSCPPSDTCGKGGCYCQLFKRKKKGATDDTPWDVAHTDSKGQTKYRPDDLEYKCFCVKPTLDAELTVDDVKYTVRYQLCTCGTCSLDVIPVLGAKTHDEVKCSGTCEGDCKCTLFRLQVAGKAGFDPKNAKWERVAKADTQVKPEDNYSYRCFCLK